MAGCTNVFHHARCPGSYSDCTRWLRDYDPPQTAISPPAERPCTLDEALRMPEIAALVSAGEMFVNGYRGDDDRIITAYYAMEDALRKVKP